MIGVFGLYTNTSVYKRVWGGGAPWRPEAHQASHVMSCHVKCPNMENGLCQQLKITWRVCFDSIWLSSPTTQTQFGVQCSGWSSSSSVDTESNGRVVLLALESIVVSETIFLGTDESRRYSLPFIYSNLYLDLSCIRCFTMCCSLQLTSSSSQRRPPCSALNWFESPFEWQLWCFKVTPHETFLGLLSCRVVYVPSFGFWVWIVKCELKEPVLEWIKEKTNKILI